ncbi:MAG: hypothetical protein R3B53_03410 [Candidatus Paceibacterota bacterium]
MSFSHDELVAMHQHCDKAAREISTSEPDFHHLQPCCSNRLPPLEHVVAGDRYIFNVGQGQIMVEVQRCGLFGDLQFVLMSSQVSGLTCDGLKPFFVSLSALKTGVPPNKLSARAMIFWVNLLTFKRQSHFGVSKTSKHKPRY